MAGAGQTNISSGGGAVILGRVAAREKVFGPEHPFTREYRDDLARIEGKPGNETSEVFLNL